MSKGKYLSNKKLYPILCKWKDKLKENPDTRLPEELGEAILLVATNTARNSKWSRYTYKEEMIEDAIYYCVKYLHNFDTVKYQNVHAYLTTQCWNAFTARLNKEENKQATKYKYYLHEVFETDHLNSGAVDSDFYFDILNKLNKYEEKIKRKKNKQKTKKQEQINNNNLESFIDE